MRRVIRVYSEEAFQIGGFVKISKEEWHYFKNVRRAQGPIVFFNRLGEEAEVEFENNEFRVLKIFKTASKVWPLKIVVGLPENQVCKDLVFTLSELGVNELSFFAASRSQAASKRRDIIFKLEKMSIESARQCARGRPLQISWMSKEELLALPAESTFVLDEQDSTSNSIRTMSSSPQPLQMIVGPEGGWTQEERQDFLSKSFRFIHFDTPILRVLTAASMAAFWALGNLGRGDAPKV